MGVENIPLGPDFCTYHKTLDQAEQKVRVMFSNKQLFTAGQFRRGEPGAEPNLEEETLRLPGR